MLVVAGQEAVLQLFSSRASANHGHGDEEVGQDRLYTAVSKFEDRHFAKLVPVEVLRAVVGVGEPARLEFVEQARERGSQSSSVRSL